VAQTFVWVDNAGQVQAYYAISAHALPRAEAPARIGRGVPDPVPAALIGKLALDRRHRGRGLGRWLLLDALERIIAASESGPAVRAIVVDAATKEGRSLYASLGFVDAPGHPTRMLIRAETVARALSRPDG
jgi:GNAT superfamily N-acetyltransferase